MERLSVHTEGIAPSVSNLRLEASCTKPGLMQETKRSNPSDGALDDKVTAEVQELLH